MGKGASAFADELLDLLRDPAFCELRQLAAERPLPWSEFRTMRMPKVLTAEQAWDALNALRRHTAVELPFHDGTGRIGWYYPTRSFRRDLDDINRRGYENSWIDSAIKSRNTTYFLIEAHVDDAIAIIRGDGLHLGYERARELLLGEREPEKPEEVLLKNVHRAIWDLERYVARPCTPELILEVYAQVSQGVGSQPTGTSAQKTRLWKPKNLDSAATLSLITNLINQNSLEFAEHPLLLAMAVRHLFMSNLPLPSWNGSVSALVMKLMFRRSRLPVLAFVPIMKTCRDWEDGVLRPPVVMTTLEDAEELIDGEVDYTVWVSVMAHLVRQKLDDIEDELRRTIEKDEAFNQTLQEGIGLNHRQRMVLQVALKNPAAVFRIAPHQRTYRVAYGTARSDLLGLAERGYLVCRRTHRAFEFTVNPGLRQLLETYQPSN